MDFMKNICRENLTPRKIVALCLVAISFAMLLLPWINMSIEVMGKKYTMQEITDLMCREMDITQSQLEAEYKESIEDLAEEAEEYGIEIKVNKMTNIISMILKGKVTPVDCASTAAYLSSFMSDVLGTAEKEGDSYESALMQQQMRTTKKSMTTAAIGIWLVIILMIASMLYAVYSLLTNKKYGVLVYAGISVWAFIAFIVVTNQLNTPSTAMFGGLYDALEDMKLFEGGGVDLKLFHLSAAPYVCVVASILAAVVGEMTQLDSYIAGALPFTEKQTCSCGAKRKPGMLFCSKCGSRFEDAAVQTPTPAPVSEREAPMPAYRADVKPVPVARPVQPPQPEPVNPPEKKDPWSNLGDL